MFYSYNLSKFITEFSSSESCLNYLSKLKAKMLFNCQKCNHTTWCKTKKVGARKCTRCKHIESATAGTLFHKCKIDLPKAFLMVFLISTNKKGISSYELGRKTSSRQSSCYYFKRKVIQVMQQQNKIKLKDNVYVDESIYGGYKKGKPGRSKSLKKEFVVAIQNKGAQIISCVAQKIDNAGSKELKLFFEKWIEEDTTIKTDKWRGYIPIKKSYPFLEQIKSDWTDKFKLIHRQIMMIKAFIRGTHHHVNNLQMYLDEYCFRANNRGKLIFHTVITKMVQTKPCKIKDFPKFNRGV